MEYAWSRGAVLVAAAGNDAADVDDYGPAGIDRVVTVAATGLDDRRAGFSNWGRAIDIAAPGLDVLSLRARRTDLMAAIEGVAYEPGAAFVGEDRRYYRASGTSFAAPLVSGTAALILAHRPELRPEQVVRMLLQSARDIDVPGRDQYSGYGLLDARAALRADPEFFVEAGIDGVEVVHGDAGGAAVRVRGTAAANRFDRAWLEIGAGEEPAEWRAVGELLEHAVDGGVLGDVPARELAGSSLWTIRLRVRHENGRDREARYRLTLE